MGIMDKWREWSKKLWDNHGSKLQARYDRFRTLETPEWYLKLTEAVWDKIDNTSKDFLNKFLVEVIARYDEKFAKELIEKIVAIFKKRFA